MTIAAIIVAALALLVAFLTMRRAAALDQRLGRLENSLYSLKGELADEREKLDERLLDLRLEMRRQAGTLKFDCRHDHRRGDGGASPGERGARQFPPGRLLALRGQRRGHDRGRVPDLRHRPDCADDGAERAD